MSRAVIYEPTGNNEIPLKYTAGMVLAVPVDCDLFNVIDIGMVRLCIKTPDQKVMVITPKRSEFCSKVKTATVSSPTHSCLIRCGPRHSTFSYLSCWSCPTRRWLSRSSRTLGPLCDPVKVYVYPKTNQKRNLKLAAGMRNAC